MTRLITVALVVVVVAFGASALTRYSNTGPATEEPADPDSVYDPIVAGEGFPGGIRWVVSRDGISPVYQPKFVTAEASPLDTEDLVIGLQIDDETRAYPVGLLAAREMVNDWVAGVPVLVSWCPLCGTGTVHRRELNGKSALFGNQGALWGNAMTWWDHETGSIWSQPLGEAIAGPYLGHRLELLPSTLTTWLAWRSAHPETLVLDGPVYPSGPNDSNTAVVLAYGDEVAAYPIELVLERGVINDVVGGLAVAVVADSDGLWTVFSRLVDGSIVDLSLRGDVLVDKATDSEWETVTGFGVNGEFAGSRLKRLPASTVFPDDFQTFWPDGRMVGR